MKIKISIILLSSFLTFTVGAKNIDFAEASMEYYRENPSLPHFNIDWNEEKKIALVTLRLKWMNFSEEMHGAGFDLNYGYRPYLVSPELWGECKLTKMIGELDRPELQAFYEVSLLLEGAECPQFFDEFEYLSLRASQYNVPLLNSDGYAINFHLFIFDSP